MRKIYLEPESASRGGFGSMHGVSLGLEWDGGCGDEQAQGPRATSSVSRSVSRPVRSSIAPTTAAPGRSTSSNLTASVRA